MEVHTRLTKHRSPSITSLPIN